MGVVSPNGIGSNAFCRAALAGTSGVRRITRFDPSDLPVQIAGEVAGFDELAWVDSHERKHLSRSVPMALAASSEALEQAGIEPAKFSLRQQREIGVVLGTGGGAQDFSEENYRLYFHGKAKQASIFSIPSGTMGTMSSEVSMRFGLRGMSHVITTGCT
jgi:3-oxoacyl-[acyl-carrier-protein] synthase II